MEKTSRITKSNGQFEFTYDLLLKAGQTTEPSEATLKADGGLQVLVRDPIAGQYDVTCDLTRTSDSSVVDTWKTATGQGVTILNSQTISLAGIGVRTNDNRTYQVRP